MAYGKPSLVGRTVAFGTVFTLFVNSSALAIGAVVPDLTVSVENRLRRPVEPYRDRPTPIVRGTGRDESHSGWWSNYISVD